MRRVDADEVGLRRDRERLRPAVARVEAQDLVHLALANPVEAGERDECVRLHGMRLVRLGDVVRQRVDADEQPAGEDNLDGRVGDHPDRGE